MVLVRGNSHEKDGSKKAASKDQALLVPNWCAWGRNDPGLERVRATSRTSSPVNGIRKGEVSGVSSTPVSIKKITQVVFLNAQNLLEVVLDCSTRYAHVFNTTNQLLNKNANLKSFDDGIRFS